MDQALSKKSGLDTEIGLINVKIKPQWNRRWRKWGNDKMLRDGGKDQDSQCLFSIQSSEIERWNKKMKEQPAYASQEQNPFITSVMFNFQQLYLHLQYSLLKAIWHALSQQ